MIFDEDEVDVRTVVESVSELLAPRAHTKNVELVAIVADDVPVTVRTDRVRLLQVLNNLVGNAVKFTEKGGVRIHVSVLEGRERRFLRFEVRDTGVGVPTGKRAEIFEEFVQADSSHARKFGGTGLGLAICKRLVVALGGDIGIEPAPEGGSRFWFTLPAVVVTAAHEHGAPPLENLRVAIVTRNLVLREGLITQLRAAGAEVASLEGQSGPRPDCVIVDAGTSAIPDTRIFPDVMLPSVVLITPTSRGKLAELKALGFAGYLVKPVRQTSLVKRLEIATQRNVAAEAPEPELPGPDAVLPPDSVSTHRGFKVLLAEDNPINALLTRELLRRRGHSVVEVTTGDAAVRAMREDTFDLVLTDIHMPGMDGIEATKAIRAEEIALGRPRTPIVALTADALETGKRACREAGMDGFLTKPVDPHLLDQMFESFFPSGAQSAAA